MPGLVQDKPGHNDLGTEMTGKWPNPLRFNRTPWHKAGHDEEAR
jgi:hypothetical protein